MIAVARFNLLGDGLRDPLDPRYRSTNREAGTMSGLSPPMF
jgi:hypothetical protein